MPTFVHGKNTKVLIGSYDLSTSFKEYSATTGIDMAETSAFGNTYKTYIQGLGDASISLSGQWATGSSSEVDDVLSAAIGSTTTLPVTICPNGYGLGKRGVGLGSLQSNYEITASIGDVVAVSAEFQSTVDTGGKSGILLTAGSSISATTVATGQDQTAATTAGGYALFHLPANTRSAAVDVIVEDSADNVSWATIATFTSVGASTIANEYKAITGTIRRYVRTTVTLAAGTGACTPHVMLARL